MDFLILSVTFSTVAAPFIYLEMLDAEIPAKSHKALSISSRKSGLKSVGTLIISLYPFSLYAFKYLHHLSLQQNLKNLFPRATLNVVSE